MKKGFFITFEGTDGSGKSTQVKILEKYLLDNGFDVVVCREPGGTKISEKIRQIIIDKNNSMSEYTEALLYAASRAELVNSVVKPALEQNKIVLCDRFLDSSLAYQSFARGLAFNDILMINEFGIKNLLPDVTFFMDILPETSLKRRREESELDRLELETLDFHRKVYDGFLELHKYYPQRIHKIEATREPLDIHRDITSVINMLIHT